MYRNNLLIYFSIILAYFAASSVGDEAIIGGTIVADPKYFRFLVSLLQVDHGHLCGGALIGKQFVLSAAHCFIHPNNTFKSMQVFALMGTTDLFKFTYPSENIAVDKIFVPSEYNATDIITTGDLAVLRLKHPIDIGTRNNLKTAKVEINRKEHYSGEKAFIAGWGSNVIEFRNNEQFSRRTDSLLRFAIVNVLDNRQCEKEHSPLRISERHLCGKIEQLHHGIYGVCYGDGGDPLIYDGTIIGILSKIPKNCIESNKPAVYTRVSYYLTLIANAKIDLISKHMRAHELYP